MFILVVLLIIVIVVLFFIMRSKQQKLEAKLIELSQHLKKTESLSNKEIEQVSKISSDYLDEIKLLENKYRELQDYCADIEKDIQSGFATSERFLMKRFYELLDNPEYQDITIYHSLGYIDGNDHLKEIDFLIITKKGILIIESKHWKGVTYIYCDNPHKKIVNTTADMFANTQYTDFAKTSIRIYQDDFPMRVFVVRENDAKGTLVIRDYNNPISQVRGYSWGVNKALGKPVANAVVFHKDEQCQVVYNDELVQDYHQIDGLTNIVVDDSIDKYLDSLGGNLTVDEMAQLADSIEQKFTYHYKMDKDNYMAQKFKAFAGDIYKC